MATITRLDDPFINRFNNPDVPPAGTWDRFYSRRQGGTFKGVTAQLDYLRDLGCGAIWLSPVVKNPRPPRRPRHRFQSREPRVRLRDRQRGPRGGRGPRRDGGLARCRAGRPLAERPGTPPRGLGERVSAQHGPVGRRCRLSRGTAIARVLPPARIVSGNGRDFGHAAGFGGLVAFSRILSDAEAVVVANTSTTEPFKGLVLVDADSNRRPRRMSVCFSNRGTRGGDTVRLVPDGRIFRDGVATAPGELAALYVELEPMEVQMLA